MNTITLTIEATPENLMKLAQAFGPGPAEQLKPEVTQEEKPTQPKPALVDPTVPEEPAPQKTVTKQDVRKVALAMSKAGKNDQLGEILGRFGATKLSQVKEDDYAALLADLEAAS